MSTLLFLHLLLIGLWAGCVAVEMVLEVASRTNPQLTAVVARFHHSIDLVVEIPVISGVLLTGVLMLDLNRMSGAYAVMVVCGTLAVLVNALCVIPVLRRSRYVDADQPALAQEQSRLVFVAFYTGAPLGAIALASGARLLGVW